MDVQANGKVPGALLHAELTLFLEIIDESRIYGIEVGVTLRRLGCQIRDAAERRFESDPKAVLAAMQRMRKPSRPCAIAHHLYHKMSYKRFREFRAFRNTVVDCLKRLHRLGMVIREDRPGGPYFRLAPKEKSRVQTRI